MATNPINIYSGVNTRSTIVGHLLQALPASSSAGGSPFNSITQFSTVAISAFGSQINSIYNALRQIEDGSDRDAALKGMRNVFLDLVRSPSMDKWSSFALTANQVASSNIGVLQQVFGAQANKPAQEAGAIWPEVNLYGRVSRSELGERFASAGLDIIRSTGSTEEKSAGFRELMELVGKVLDRRLSSEDRDKVADALFQGLNSSGSLAEKRDFIAKFDIDAVLNPPPEA